MGADFEYMVAYYIIATAWERVGRHDIAKEIWEELSGVGDVIRTIAESDSVSSFYKPLD